LLKENDIEGGWSEVKSLLLHLSRKYIPVLHKNRKRKKNDWMNEKTLKQLQARDKAWKKYKRYRSDINYNKYKKIRNQVVGVICVDKRTRQKDLIKTINRNPRKFYGYVRNLQTVKARVARIRRKDGSMTTNDQETANALCEHYEEVFVKEDIKDTGEKFYADLNGERSDQGCKLCGIEVNANQVDFRSSSIGDWSGDIANWEESVDEVKFDIELVTRKLKKLNLGKSPGPDGIHPMLLKNCAEELSTPLSLLFKWLYEQGQLPNDWKNAHLTSIYEKGDKSDAEINDQCL
jgi:hypothetical protein